jgi:hypothetical protein
MADREAPNAVVDFIDTAWLNLGKLCRLPSAKPALDASPKVDSGADLPQPSAARPERGFRLQEVKGDYDYTLRTSQYTSKLLVGTAKVCTCLQVVQQALETFCCL